MRKKDAISYFGSAAELARSLNISEPAVSRWGETIPKGRAYQIEVLTDGKLKADSHSASQQPTPCV
ncbi:MAG: Cro/CI family transcriptional regulator [Aeromonas sobria]|uniref:Cro/Cl family transcriptional regulator n=1 Tax=Aeromonas sobria TaxID=646 RepID=A0A2N3J1X0_AERSO|nr:Cro/CI family transcriptional regulator [Aeromonas sobria]PKQ79649.1 Cro/Cl family transcriptional regulator [Aeromonas sobria]